MHCCLVQSRSLRKQKKKILQVPPVTWFLNTSCTFSSNSKQKQEPRDLPRAPGAQTRRGPAARGRSALAGKFCPAPALPSPFRGWVHARAFSWVHPMGALQPHREKNRLLGKHNTLPQAGAGATTERGESDAIPKRRSRTPRGLAAITGRNHSPAATLFRWAPPFPQGSHPTLTAASRRGFVPPQPGRWANDLPSPATGGRRGNKILPAFPFAPSPLPSWRPPPRSCPSSYGPFPSCRVLN